MSKKRLEEIKYYYREMETFDPGTQSDINWLIEQAELGISQQEQFHDYQTQNLRLQKRVQELEEAIADYAYEIGKRKRALNKKNEQNKRYREALEEIASKRMTYAEMFGAIRTAKEALKGE